MPNRTKTQLVALMALGAMLSTGEPARAQLDLPRKTIVVKDFARLRQDLLDTLRVNLPDAEVEIVQFRGAEVVLTVSMHVARPPANLHQAELQLRDHCDRLIRSSARGMVLAPSSVLEVIAPIPEPSDDPEAQALLERLRTAVTEVRAELMEDEEALPGDEASPVEPEAVLSQDVLPDPDASGFVEIDEDVAAMASLPSPEAAAGAVLEATEEAESSRQEAAEAAPDPTFVALVPPSDPAERPEGWTSHPISARIRSIWTRVNGQAPPPTALSPTARTSPTPRAAALPAPSPSRDREPTPAPGEGTLPTLQDRLQALLQGGVQAHAGAPGETPTAAPRLASLPSPAPSSELVPGPVGAEASSGPPPVPAGPPDELLYGASDTGARPEDLRQPLFRQGFQAYLAHLTGKPVEALQEERDALRQRLVTRAPGPEVAADAPSLDPPPAPFVLGPPPPLAVPRPARTTNITAVSLEALRRNTPVAPKPESGLARIVLEEEAEHRAMISKLQASENVSPETAARIQDFHENGRAIEFDSSEDTVRAVYQQIFADRSLDRSRMALERNLDLPPDATLGSLAQLPPPAASGKAAGPISASLDDLLTQEIHSLFDSGAPHDIEEAPDLE